MKGKRMYPSTEPLPQPDHPRQGHHYDVSLGEAPSSGYIPGHAQSWRVIDETIGIDEHADAAREAAQPPAS
ncbi:MAG TPA: hypothetical protein VN255_08205, partial [Mycobacterium sp.]|nr:hypothetical protein [Mycobacterium sp.]